MVWSCPGDAEVHSGVIVTTTGNKVRNGILLAGKSTLMGDCSCNNVGAIYYIDFICIFGSELTS
jgi:hypothetical protein